MSRLKAPFSTTELTYRDHDHVLQVLVDLPLFSRRLGLDDVGVGARQAVGGSPDFLLFLLRQKEKKSCQSQVQVVKRWAIVLMDLSSYPAPRCTDSGSSQYGYMRQASVSKLSINLGNIEQSSRNARNQTQDGWL